MKSLFIYFTYFEYFIFLVFILSLQIIETESYIKEGNGYRYNNKKMGYLNNKNKGKQYDLCFFYSLPLLLFIFFLKYLYYRIVYNEI